MRSSALLLPFLLVAAPGHTSPCDYPAGIGPRVSVVGWRGFIPDRSDSMRTPQVAGSLLALCPMPVDRPEMRWLIPNPTSGSRPGSGVLKPDSAESGPVSRGSFARGACWNPLG